MNISNTLQTTLLSVFLLATFNAYSSTATYRLTVNNNWTIDNAPINFPLDAHLSWLGGGTHDATQNYWKLGGLANTGFERMAETGVTSSFVAEIAQAGSPLEWKHWFCPSTTNNINCGSLTETFTIDSDKPLITLTSMLGPSPDWFIGVSGLSLRDGNGWIDNLTTPLALYDAGTEDGSIPIMMNSGTNPFQPISLIAYNPVTGEYTSSNTEYIIGSFNFELLNVSPIPLPASLWLFLSGFVTLRAFYKKRY